MDKLLNYIKKKDFKSDIIYIGIGSASLRELNKENMQQFPPWLENIWRTTNLSITLINIDMKFETPYLLTSYLNLSKLYTQDDKIIEVYQENRLECIYVNTILNYNIDNEIVGSDIIYLDELNKIVIDNNKILICGDYTGRSNNILELYFCELYQYSNKYSYGYLTKITYNFMSDLFGSCTVNLIKEFPLIDIDNRQIIKLSNTSPDNLNALIEIYRNFPNFKEKIIKIIFIMLKYISNTELYLYRNYLNKNYQKYMDTVCIKSIIHIINISDYLEFENTRDYIKNKIINYSLELINILKYYINKDEFNEIENIIISIPIDSKLIYSFCNEYLKSVNKLKSKFCENI
jgi:hypothetical protein